MTTEKGILRDAERVRVLPKVNETGLVDLGARNRSALARLANLATHMVANDIPIPPSPFVDLIVNLITGKDKQDFRMSITGAPGTGKSYSAIYIAKRVAVAVAAVLGGTWKNYFSLDNCALLEDSDGVNKVLKNSKKHQVVLIDDAGVAVGSREFQSIQNKNFNKLLATCRTQRWCLIFTAPLQSHIDKQSRELIYVKAVIYKSFHEGGFNVLKIGKIRILESFNDKIIAPRFIFEKRKIDFWVAFAPDKALSKDYDIRRDESA